MYIYKIEKHIVSFYRRLRRFTKRPVFTTDAREAKSHDFSGKELMKMGKYYYTMGLSRFGCFYVIDADEKGKHRYFTGQWGGSTKDARLKQPIFTSDIHKALFFLDREAGDETLNEVRLICRKPMESRAVYMDIENTLPQQRFIIICESENGELGYYAGIDGHKIRTRKRSKYAVKLPLRSAIALYEKLLHSRHKQKFSVLHDPNGDVSIGNIGEYLRREKPNNAVSLTMKFKQS